MEIRCLFNISSVCIMVAIVTCGLAEVDATDSVGLPRDCHLNQVKANPKNSHTFYWCLADGPVLMKCVDSLVFEQSAKKCITKREQQQRQKRHKGDKLVNYMDHKKKPSSSSSSSSFTVPSISNSVFTSTSKDASSNTISATVSSFPRLPPLPVPLPVEQAPELQEENAISSSSSSDVPAISSSDVPAAPSLKAAWIRCPKAYQTGRDALTIYQPSPRSCTEFYVCSNGDPLKLECPEGTVFNSDENVCDWSRNVPGCEGAYLKSSSNSKEEQVSSPFTSIPSSFFSKIQSINPSPLHLVI